MSDRDTVETLLAMGFIPTWLEELLDEGDRNQKLMTRWFNSYNDLVSSYGAIQKRLVARGYRATIAEEKLDAIQKICTECNIIHVEECFNDIIRIVVGVKDPHEVGDSY